MNSLHNDTLAFIESIGLSGSDKKKTSSVKGDKNNDKKDNTRKWGKGVKGKKDTDKPVNGTKHQKKEGEGPGKRKDSGAKAASQDLGWLASAQASECAISITEDTKWYQLTENFDNVDVNDYRTSKQNIANINSSIEGLFAKEVAAYHKSKKSGALSEDDKWMNEVIQSGTLSDKVAALALRIQQSPPHELETLDTLIAMALKKEQRTSQMALEALKDLLLHNLLPDRHLKLFKVRPLGHPELTKQITLVFWFENELMKRIVRIVEALENGMKSSVDFFKRKCMEIVSEWIIAKPEQENTLLALLVNKLGDPSSKICAKAVSLLGSVVYRHAAMKGVVVREVRQLIARPNLPPRATYSAIIFLSQISLSTAEQAVAEQLVECYVSLFEKAVTQEQLGSKLLAALLLGINRAFPFLSDKASLERNLDSLFKISQTASFSSATQALTLISHLAVGDAVDAAKTDGSKYTKKDKAGSVESDKRPPVEETSLVTRFYRALYAKLLCDEILTRTHNTLFLNLLYRSMKRDPSDLRVMGFVKRLLVCSLHSTPPVAAGIIFLVSEVSKTRLSLRQDLLATVESLPESLGEGYFNLGNFDASKRDGQFACTTAPSAWELSMMRLHFHPSVQAFASSFLGADTDHKITYNGDPTVDFSLSSFLNRFSYKNPKKSQVDIRRRRSQVQAEDPVNLSSVSAADAAPEKMFFYKFFGERNRLRAEGKSRNRSRHRKSEDDDDDDDSDLGSDMGEDAIDRFADKLAEDLMENHDDEDVDLDDDDDDDLGDADDDDDDDDTGIFEADGSDDDDGDGVEEDGDGGLQRWVDSDEDDDDGEAFEQGDDDLDDNFDDVEDSDDSALDFDEFLEKQKTKQKSDKNKKNKKEEKAEKKKRKALTTESVFATADSYEDEIEALVAAVRANGSTSKAGSSTEDNSQHAKKRRKKQK